MGLKNETRPTLVQTPTGNKCDNVKTGTRRFSSKGGPGQNWWVPHLPSDRPFPSIPLVVTVRRVPRPNRTLGTCALRALRCVVPTRSPSLRVAVAGSHPFTAPSCRSFRQLCPSLEKPRPGFPLDVVVNASGGCLFAWFFVFCFVLFFFFFS